MAFAIKARLDGAEEAIRSLDGLSRTLRNQILRKAINAASKVVLDAARKLVPVETGMLKKSLAVRIQTYRSTGTVVGVIGPRTGYKKTRQGKVLTSFGRKIKSTGRNPSKYAHLIEFGHNIARPKGKLVGYARARAFLRPAFDQNKAAIEKLLTERVAEEIEKAARKGKI